MGWFGKSSRGAAHSAARDHRGATVRYNSMQSGYGARRSGPTQVGGVFGHGKGRFALALFLVILLVGGVFITIRSIPASRQWVGVNLSDHLGQTQSSLGASKNWAGFESMGGPSTDVQATWTVPTVQCGWFESSEASFWVGLDGASDTSTTLQQIGALAGCGDGFAFYQPWYELYPAGPVTIGNTLAPGDVVSAEVQTDGQGNFTLSLDDVTAGWVFQTNQTQAGASLDSAEIVAEAPTSAFYNEILPLSNFDQVDFSNCQVNGQPIGSASSVTRVVMRRAQQGDYAIPTNLGTDNQSFAVYWYQR